tara:strand:+ start:59 stop:811 length:753 start_codon:yes stop_codon:yes gene_type:complete
MKKISYYVNKFLNNFGYKISKFNNTDELVKIYKYKNYEEYKKTQIYHNKNKIKYIFSDETTLNSIKEYLLRKISMNNINGICHGSRNGFELHFFNNSIPNSNIIGTDISDNASNFKNTIIHDFHNVKKEWISYFDFVYSNSLDQSYDPKKALKVWLDQIKKDRYLFIELSDQHNVKASGKMDPFGVETFFFPYLLVEWFGQNISIEIIKNIKSNKNLERKVDMGDVIKEASFVAEGLSSYIFVIKKLKDF